MSRGEFEYKNYILEDFINIIEEHIKNNNKIPYDNPQYSFEEIENDNFIKKGNMIYDNKTIEQFKTAQILLSLSLVYINNIDLLLSGDSSEKTFHKELDKELTNLIHKIYE